MSVESYHGPLKANKSSQVVALSPIKFLSANKTLLGLLKKMSKRKLAAEEFGGIEFVQVGLLSSSHKKLLRQSPVSKKMMTILRGKELLYDCLSYKDYCDCYINWGK